MTVQQFRTTYELQPFRPFVIHLADGREIAVSSRELIYMFPRGRTIIVVQPDETFNIIDLLLITDLEFKPLANSPARRRR